MTMHVPAQVTGKVLLDADALSRTLSRIAHEIIEANPSLDEVALVGIQTRGVPIAHRLARLIEERAGEAPDLGAVDITFYRDDVSVRGGEAPRNPSSATRSSASRSRAARSSSSTTSSTRAARSVPRSRRSSTTAVRRASS